MRNTPKKANSDRNTAKDRGWVWGRHAVLAVLDNPARKVYRLCVTLNASRELPEGLTGESLKPAEIDRLLPEGAVHQGFAAEVSALPAEPVQAVADPTHGVLVVLDQITDPHNVGAIFRSAAAFGTRAVIMQDGNCCPRPGHQYRRYPDPSA